jgi:hypothetical protein
LHYRQKKPVKADYPSFKERPNAQKQNLNYKNQCRVIVSVLMNLRITWKDGQLLD